MKNIVVGGAGFIGSCLVDNLILRGNNEVVVIDNLFSGSLKNLDFIKDSKRLTVYKEDFSDIKRMRSIFRKEKPDMLFNLATVGLIRSLDNPIWCFDQEIRLAETACQLTKEGLVKRLVHFSSSEVYGNVKMPVIDPELSRTKPTTTYAAGKLAADHLISTMIDLFSLDAVIIRPFNNFGSRQYNLEHQGIIPKAINLLRQNKPITIYGNGSQTRDFIHVGDTIERLFSILRYHFVSPKEKRRKIYHICSEQEVSMLTLVEMISGIGNFDLRINFIEERKGEVKRLIGKQTLIDNEGFKKLIPLEESISNLIKMENVRC